MKRKKQYKTSGKFKGSSKELRKKTKKLLEKVGRRNRQFMNISCSKCKRELHIRVNDKSIYTEEMIKNYICLLCKPIEWGKRK